MMQYFKHTWSEKRKNYIVSEISEEEAFLMLQSSYVETDSFRGKQFRLKTKYGSIIETKTETGLCPVPGFFGVCD